jgi:hypothetical protein
MTAKSIARQQRIIARHRLSAQDALTTGHIEFAAQQTALADAAEINLRMDTDQAFAASRNYRMAYAV